MPYATLVIWIKERYVKLLLAAILILAGAFRFPLLTVSPPGFYVDEASTGYDAYSILLTGKDQYGEFMPLFARTFGAYNESLYRFITVIPIKLFGLNEFAVRLPAAVFGFFTVWALYFLAKELFDEHVALLATLLLAISPWHIQFSRVAFRAILLPFFICWGLYFFLKGRKNPRYYVLASAAFSVSLYTYASARVFVPLFLLVVIILFWDDLRRGGKWTWFAGGMFTAVFLFFTQYWLSPQGIRESFDSVDSGVWLLLRAYASYYNPVFLFFDGDPVARHNVANFGQLHVFELVTIPLGLFFLLRERQRRTWLLLAWLVFYPLPAALTDAEHSLRAIIGVLLFALLSAYGLARLLAVFSGRRQQLLAVAAAAFIIWRVVVYTQWYFVIYPVYSAKAWQYGMKEAITYTVDHPTEQVHISNRFFIPHMFVLFYTAYPPEMYHREALFSVGEGDFHYTEATVGHYAITSAQNMAQLNYEDALLLVFPEEVETVLVNPECQEAHTIYHPDGTIAIVLIACGTEMNGAR